MATSCSEHHDDEQILVSGAFDTPGFALASSGLSWFVPPSTAATPEPHVGLRVTPDGDTDFWSKTYYKPLLLKYDGHHLCAPIEGDFMVETTFEITATNQFDQAGIMLRYDDNHWIKTGIEYADGVMNLSVVVTNEYSDWSTTPWPSNTLSLRVYKLGNDVVVERKDHDSERWLFVRIARIRSTLVPHAGVFLACPAKVNKGGSTVFRNMVIRRSRGYHHTNAQ